MSFKTYYAVFSATGEMISAIDFFRSARSKAILAGGGAYVLDRNLNVVFKA